MNGLTPFITFNSALELVSVSDEAVHFRKRASLSWQLVVAQLCVSLETARPFQVRIDLAKHSYPGRNRLVEETGFGGQSRAEIQRHAKPQGTAKRKGRETQRTANTLQQRSKSRLPRTARDRRNKYFKLLRRKLDHSALLRAHISGHQ